MASRHEFKIGENRFYIRKFDAFLSLRVLGDLQKRFLGPLAAVLESQTPAGQSAGMEGMMAAIEKLSMSLDGDAIVDLAKKLLNPEFVSVSIGSEPPDKLTEGMLNRAAEDVGDVVTLIMEVIKVNYTSLFTQGRTLIGLAQSSTETR